MIRACDIDMLHHRTVHVCCVSKGGTRPGILHNSENSRGVFYIDISHLFVQVAGLQNKLVLAVLKT